MANEFHGDGIGNTVLPSYCGRSVFVLPWELDFATINGSTGVADTETVDIITIPAGTLVIGGWWKNDREETAGTATVALGTDTSGDGAIFRTAAALGSTLNTKVALLAGVTEANIAKNFAFTEKALRATLGTSTAKVGNISGALICVPIV